MTIERTTANRQARESFTVTTRDIGSHRAYDVTCLVEGCGLVVRGYDWRRNALLQGYLHALDVHKLGGL